MPPCRLDDGIPAVDTPFTSYPAPATPYPFALLTTLLILLAATRLLLFLLLFHDRMVFLLNLLDIDRRFRKLHMQRLQSFGDDP